MYWYNVLVAEICKFWFLVLECAYIYNPSPPFTHSHSLSLSLLSPSTPRSFLLEDRCRFLSNFSQATADVGIPGEYLIPKVYTM